MEKKKYAIATLGCKVNTFEAESINEAMKERGFIEVDFKEYADIYIVFTCAVTNTAASKSRQKVSQANHCNPDAIICVVGCYVQINADKLQEDERIDILVGSSGKYMIPDLIQRAFEERNKIVHVNNVLKDVKFDLLPINMFNHHTRAFLKIQDGCNQYCSFCIIPYARGKERSLDADEVIHQARQLAENHHEIVLSGIHTGRYGINSEVDLTTLIKRILKEVSIARIRISSIEVTEITDEFIDLMANNNRLCKHLHIPIQSGSDAVLKRMHRPYTIAMFKDKVKEIRKKIPSISISTDLIVGFPDETDQEFVESMDTMKELKLSFMHVFPYSAKDGTIASKIKPIVSSQEKKHRVSIANSVSMRLYYAYMTSFVNQEVDVLIEKSDETSASGYTSQYVKVIVDTPVTSNKIVKVICTHFKDDTLHGKVVEENVVESIV
ncbi:tRNA (N(6)-L-threonylcarbamoyladenosine(37)-C(2))-methylthiotransferase MtaB [Erysipelotrichaceae bacterium OH741_COT-311]|nr:tRNA (N(6)-L-threonylcarbamoyladenosine(37)-C(2))-methylthiotransferase MtaB [Erysipelotrichaceae bacterium OH741_COT-311]